MTIKRTSCLLLLAIFGSAVLSLSASFLPNGVGGGKAYAAPASKAHPVSKKSQLHCTSKQRTAKISSGKNKGKYYCKAKSTSKGNAPVQIDQVKTPYHCGGDKNGHKNSDSVETSINIGCDGKGNAILDMLFAIIRFLSYGVGLVLVASLIVGGIQYTASTGDQQATATAVKRLKSVIVALLLFIFAYAILNYVIPGAVLK